MRKAQSQTLGQSSSFLMLSRKKIEDFVFKMKEWKASSMVGGAKICLTQLLYNELDKATL